MNSQPQTIISLKCFAGSNYNTKKTPTWKMTFNCGIRTSFWCYLRRVRRSEQSHLRNSKQRNPEAGRASGTRLQQRVSEVATQTQHISLIEQPITWNEYHLVYINNSNSTLLFILQLKFQEDVARNEGLIQVFTRMEATVAEEAKR